METYRELYPGHDNEANAFWNSVLCSDSIHVTGYEPESDEDADLSAPPSPDDDLWLTATFAADSPYTPPRRGDPPHPGQLSIHDAIADIETYRNRIG